MTPAPPTTPLPLGQDEPGDERQRADAECDLGIVDALAQLSFLIHGTIAVHAAEHDSSMIQTRLLGVLRDREPTMQELATLLGLDKSSVSGLVDRAEKRRLVQRTPSTEDRRTIRVRLTPSGRRTVDGVSKAFQADVSSFIDCLTAGEQRQLSILATRIVKEQAALPAG